MRKTLAVLTALISFPLAVSAGVTPTSYDPATATGGLQLSDGNLTTTVNGTGIANSGGVRSVHSVTSGKYYWEVKLLCPVGSNVFDTLGFSAGVVAPDIVSLTWNQYFHFASSNSVWGFLTDGPDAHHGNSFRRLFNNAGNMVDQDVIRLALDMDNGLFWLGRNDQWADGDPATGANPTFSGLPGELYAAIMAGSRQCSAPPNYLAAVTNFGPTFDYPVPEGFNAGFGPIDPDVVDVAIDIKPGSCPNSLNCKPKGVLPVAILGAVDFDVTEIDPATVRLAGVAPLRWDLEDVATPHEPFTGKQDCTVDCTEMGSDGYLDATLKFDTQEVIAALGEAVQDDVCIVAKLTGKLRESVGGTEIVGEDVISINCKGK